MEEILHQAEQFEKEYDWLGAAESYGKALNLLSEDDFSRKGDITERLGYAFYRFAFQAETNEDFRNRLHKSTLAYEKATEFYVRQKESEKTSRTLHCNGMIAHIGYWLAPEASEKKKSLDDCWRVTKESLKAFDEAGDQLGYGKTCIELIDCLDRRLDLELDMRMRESILEEAVGLGEKAMRIFSDVRDERELARACCLTSIHCFNAAESLQLETKRKECEQKAFSYAKEAIKISENVGDKFLLSKSAIWLGWAELDLGAGTEAASKLFTRALQTGLDIRDHRILSEVYDGLAYSTTWPHFSISLEENLEQVREKSRESEEHAREAIRCSLLINYGYGIPHSYSVFVGDFLESAKREIRSETRYELLKKAVAFGKQGLEHAQCTGSTHAINHVSMMLAQALRDLSTIATGGEKRQFLEEAMTLGKKALQYAEQLRPSLTLPQSHACEELALTLLELSKPEHGSEKRKELLEKSVFHMETCITLHHSHMASFPPRRELFATLGRFQTELGDILNELYQTTNEKGVLKKLIETYHNAGQTYEEAALASRAAEAYWKAAVACDRVGEHLESASNFVAAFYQYELSAHNIPQLKSFYMDHATYMQAWTEIEKARHHHDRQEYGLAKEHYEKAATMHESLKQWRYLAPNYSAWAQVETAEDLSRSEKSEEALQSFEEAAKLFAETKKALETKIGEIEDLDEKTMATRLVKGSDIRREYCLGRMALEEAKILDKKGDHFSSSQKYGSLAQTFERMIPAMESEREKKEFKLIATLSQAWQRMTRAEAEESPHLYLEASQLFEEAKDLSPNEHAKILTLGHSRFCKALEVGTRFVDSRDPALHAIAIQHLESAATYYVKAGFQKASEYAKATEQLFDAYMHVDNAKREGDPDKKAKFYAMAEKILQSSAGSFMKAEHPEKREQVLRLLEKVREERELATSLCEVLHAPPIVSATTTFGTPAPTDESAVGSERFEHAEVQANLIVRQKELKVGEPLSLEIELVNAGKGPALLIKINEVIPEGFELGERPETYRVEDSYIDMKGKRLGPLKTEELRLILKPKVQGTFALKPTILYLDENGKYKSHELETVTIIVKELGIKGWIKGER